MSPSTTVSLSATSTGAPTVSVIVPSYRRPASLAACLLALAEQRTPAEEVIVVARAGDDETIATCAASKASNVRLVVVDRPGTVAALNTGVRSARGEVIAITDDDAQPEEDWLTRIGAEFAADSGLGAVGGADLIEGLGHERVGAGRVGRVAWYGRMTGNHHAGTVREEVDYLKGVNMAFRATALSGFDELLRGSGAQVGLDMEAPLAVKRRGYRVLYDPSLRVRHFPALRAAGGPRKHRSLKLLRDQHHNESYITVSTLPFKRAAACLVYSVVVGYRTAPGLAHLLLRLISGPERRRAAAEFASVMIGRVEGVATALRTGGRRRARAGAIR